MSEQNGQNGNKLDPGEAIEVQDTINLAAGIIGVSAALAGVPGVGLLASATGNLLFNAYAPGQTPQALYFKALAKMIEQLEMLMVAEFNRVEQQIQGLVVDIMKLQAAIEKLGVQIDLLAYENARSVVNQYYEDFSDFSISITKPGQSKDKIKESSEGMFALLSPDSATSGGNKVSIALNDIQNAVMSSGDTQGLIDRQASLVRHAVSNWVADTSHYSAGNIKTPRFGPYDAPAYEKVFNGAYGTAAPEAIDSYVIELLRDILITQYRGLTFLTYAWGGTALQPQLKGHRTNAQQIFSAISQLTTTLSSAATVKQTLNAAFKRTPLKSGPTVMALPPSGAEGETITLDNYYVWNASSSFQAVRMNVVVPDKGELDFGGRYVSYSLKYSPEQEAHLFNLFSFSRGHTTVPHPHDKIPKPLSPKLSELDERLKKAGAAADGPQIKLSELPDAPSHSIAGKVTKLDGKSKHTVAVFEVSSPATARSGHALVWTLQQADVPIGADGSFSAAVSPDKPLYWTVLVVDPDWIWEGQSTKAPPKIDTHVAAFKAVVAAAKT